jgi:hypothetical protein
MGYVYIITVELAAVGFCSGQLMKMSYGMSQHSLKNSHRHTVNDYMLSTFSAAESQIAVYFVPLFQYSKNQKGVN